MTIGETHSSDNSNNVYETHIHVHRQNSAQVHVHILSRKSSANDRVPNLLDGGEEYNATGHGRLKTGGGTGDPEEERFGDV